MNTERQHIETLLLRQAAGNLSEADGAQLERLLAAHPEVDRDCFERAAATVLLAACADAGKPMPAALRQKLQADAGELIGGKD